MRAITLALVLMACGSDDAPPGPHDEIACDESWPLLAETCERACEFPPDPTQAYVCGDIRQCTHVIVDGVDGCCVPDPEERGVWRWLECQ